MAGGKRLTPEDLELEGSMVAPQNTTLKEARESVEKDLVQKALRKHGGKIAPAYDRHEQHSRVVLRRIL